MPSNRKFAYRKNILRIVFCMLHVKHILGADSAPAAQEREKNLHIFIGILRIVYLLE